MLADYRPFAARGHIVQNPTYWRAKECDKTPLGNVNKEKLHFSSYLCFILESGTFCCVLVPCDLQLQKAYCSSNDFVST